MHAEGTTAMRDEEYAIAELFQHNQLAVLSCAEVCMT
jgi:hypothetical protein